MITKSSYRKIIYLAMWIQFVNFLEFMVINPLSPDYVIELGIMSSDVGWIIAAYAFSASIFGLFASTFVDKYDRKKVLLICIIGMAVGTLLCVLSFNFFSLIVSRIISGAFGGPATAITFAIITDFVPDAKRGRALGKIMSAFPLVSVFGVPLALEIARFSHWRMAYSLIFIFELIIIIAVARILPSITGHINSKTLNITKLGKLFHLLTNQKYLLGISSMFLTFFSFFLIVPIIPTYFVFNLDYPRDNLAMLFFIGGIISFFTVRYVGKATDRFDHSLIVSIITILFIPSVILGYGQHFWKIPPLFIFISFMMCVSSRNAAMAIATSKLPSQHDRAGYMTLQNSLQNFAIGAGGAISGLLLSEGENLQVVGLDRVTFITIISSLMIPIIVKSFEKNNS